jgi:subtilisin family serine protease
VADGAQPNIVVAVIDSGLDLSHKDGPQYLWTNTGEILGNGLDDDGNGYVDDVHGWNFIGESNDITDDYGHGTFVAGIIAARTHNGEGIAGIDPGARIMALKATDGNGSASALSIYRAIRYAVDNGARVINISLGEKGISRLEQLAINYAHAMGALVVVSAGNQAGDISAHGPPGARRAFSVGAVNIDGKHRDASNSGLNVAVSAPGESIYSLSAKQGKRDGRIMPLLPGDYHRLNGTSFSAPFVAGTAALIWSKRPDLSNEQVEDLITRTAKDLPPEGWDRKTGTGMLDAYGALTRDPAEAASAKIVEYRILRDGKRAIAVNLYGVVRGAVSEYRLEIGAGESPDRWQPLLGPLTQKVDYGLIGSIGGQHLVRGDTWSVRLTAVDASKRVWIQHIVIAAKDTAP